MRRAYLLAALALAVCVAVVSATTPAPQTDCSLKSISISSNSGPLTTTPAFARTKQTGYTITVPYDVDYVYITAWANASPSTGIYIAYYTCAGSNTCAVQPAGNSVVSGSPSPQINLQVGINRIDLTVACGCSAVYEIVITRQTMSYTKGDPLFAGLLGQQFQVHGVAGEVYNIVSDPVMQMNSRFVFLRHGDCPVLNGRKAHACWSHPGSYLGELGIQTCSGERLLIASGSAKNGFARVELDGKEIDMDDVVPLSCELPSNGTAEAIQSSGYVVRNSTHLVTVQLSNFLFQIENSDHFVNYRVKVLDWANLPGTHGLLGQTYQKPAKPGKQIKEIEGNVDMYQIEDHSLWGNEFAFNRFQLAAKLDDSASSDDSQ